MRTDLTQEQIDSYRNNGFVIMEDFLCAQELDTWRKTVDDAVNKRGQNLLPFGRPQGPQFSIATPHNNKKKKRFKQVLKTLKNKLRHKKEKVKTGQRKPSVLQEYDNLWEDFPEYRKLILDERIGKMAAELEGVSSMRVWNDKVLFKPAWGNPSVWHSDVPYGSYDSHHSPTFWIALEDATLQNGCMHYLPGTHKLHGFKAAYLDANLGTLFKTFPQFAKIDAVAVQLKAGSCVIHNALIVHAAGANMTPNVRKAVNITFIPGDTTYNGKECYYFPQERFDVLKPGDLLDDDKYNPIVYSSSTATSVINP